MKHLSIRSTEFSNEQIMQIRCAYRMGDEFVAATDEVDCPTCLKQIAILQGKKVSK